MKKYYVYYPREYANEYTVLAAEGDTARSWAADKIEQYADNINASYQMITRSRAQELAPKHYISIDAALAQDVDPIDQGDCERRAVEVAACDYSGKRLVPGVDF